ncbi:hypothetical protein ACFLVN_02535, partial [Chloroflexota bacterium]
ASSFRRSTDNSPSQNHSIDYSLPFPVNKQLQELVIVIKSFVGIVLLCNNQYNPARREVHSLMRGSVVSSDFNLSMLDWIGYLTPGSLILFSLYLLNKDSALVQLSTGNTVLDGIALFFCGVCNRAHDSMDIQNSNPSTRILSSG